MIERIKYYRLAIFIGFLFTVNSLASAIVASFLNTDWSSLSGTSKFLVIIVVFQGWTGTMLAYFNKTLTRLEAGKTPFETGDSEPRAFVKSDLIKTPPNQP